MNNKVIISEKELQYLEACDFTLHQVSSVIGLCPNCQKAILIDGLVCLNCGYYGSTINSYTIEEWQELNRN